MASSCAVGDDVDPGGSSSTRSPDSLLTLDKEPFAVEDTPALIPSDEVEPAAKKKRTSGRGYYCYVPECSNRSVDKSLSFHRFPTDGAKCCEWVRAIRREVGKNFKITGNTRVCSDHFNDGDYIDKLASGEEAVKKRLKTGTVPSQFSWSAPAKAPRRVLKRKWVDTSESLPGEGVTEEQQPCSDSHGDGITPPFGDHHYILADASSPSRLILDSVESLQHELARVKQEYDELSSRCVHLSAIKDNQVKFKHFTGLLNSGTFSALFCYLEPKASRLKVWRGQSTLREVCASGPVRRGSSRAHLRKVSLEDQFFVVLLRLQTAPSELQLAYCLGIHESTFSRIFITWINFLAYELSGMHVFPTSHTRVMASSFQRFPHTRIVIDCTEIFTKRPSGLQARKQLFSSYNHHNTAKFLVGISPSGAVLFVSEAYGGRAIDKKITLQSGLLQKLSRGQDVMADRGFTIEKELEENGNGLIIPTCVGAHRTQLHAREVTATRRIAESRIHVERAIARIKEFTILQGEVDVSLIHVIEQVFQVCAWLTNFQTPIVKAVYVS